ncbi:MAG: TonB-dependent receptor domain-containing protein [Gammaproteobacteria bacterium]
MKKYLIPASLILGATVPGVPLRADEETSDLPPMTVTATRTEMNTRLISTTLITREDIERLQVNTVEQALRGIAGINIGNSGGLGKQTSIFLRGTNSSQVLVLIDGIRVGSATSGTTPFELVPIEQIESIEVVRGPRSSLYGSEAIGGIIHIHTRRGGEKAFQPTFSAGTGSHDRHRYGAGVSGNAWDTWYNINVSHEQSNGYDSCSSIGFYGCFLFADESDRDGFRNESGSARLGHRFADWLSVEGHALYSDGDTEFDGSVFSGNQTDFVEQVIGGETRIDPFDFWRVTFKGGESRDRQRFKFNGADVGFFNTERVSFTAQNDFSLGDDHLLTLGYDYLDDRVGSSTDFQVTARHNHGYFAQYQGHFLRNEIILGIRHDDNEQFGHHDTWNAAWGYAFDNGIEVSASYATAYKAPTFNDLYFPDFFGFPTANPDLSPERSKSFELGVGGRHDWGHWSLNGYLTYIDDLIALDAAFVPQNIATARIMGLEAIAGGEWFGFIVNANLTLLEPENLSSGPDHGNVLPRRAEQVFRLDIDRRFGPFGLGGTVIAEGRRFDDAANTRRLGGFVTLDLRAEYELIDNLTVQARVNNILDKHYQTVAGFDADDLNLFFTLRYSPDI